MGERFFRLQHRIAPYLFVAPFLILFAVFGVYPIVKALGLSFYATSGPRDAVPVGFKNYGFLWDEFWRRGDFWKAVWNTLTYTLCSLCLQLPIALGLALLLSQRGLKGVWGWRLAVFAPNLMGQVFTAVLFTVLLMPQFGLVNKGLAMVLGRQWLDTKWLSEPDFIMPAIVLVSLWLYCGYNMIYFLAALQGVDRDLYEAALVDGANSWQQFWAVTLPAIKPVATFVMVTATIGSFQLFELPYQLLNGGGADNRGLTIVSYLYMNGFLAGDLGYASAVGWVLALMMLVVSLIQVRLSGAGTRD